MLQNAIRNGATVPDFVKMHNQICKNERLLNQAEESKEQRLDIDL